MRPTRLHAECGYAPKSSLQVHLIPTHHFDRSATLSGEHREPPYLCEDGVNLPKRSKFIIRQHPVTRRDEIWRPDNLTGIVFDEVALNGPLKKVTKIAVGGTASGRLLCERIQKQGNVTFHNESHRMSTECRQKMRTNP